MRFSAILAGLLSASAAYAVAIDAAAAAAAIAARDDTPTPVEGRDAPADVVQAAATGIPTGGACRPGTYQCVAATQVQVCNAQGGWLESARCRAGCCTASNGSAWCTC